MNVTKTLLIFRTEVDNEMIQAETFKFVRMGNGGISKFILILNNLEEPI